MILSWTATGGYVPLQLHMVGQRPSTHRELMLDNPKATYYCVLFAPPTQRGLPIYVRLFSSATLTSSLQLYTHGNNKEHVLPLTSMLHRSLANSYSIRQRTILSDAVELFVINGEKPGSNGGSSGDGSTFLEVRNQSIDGIVVQITYQLHAKTTQVFPTGTRVIPTPVSATSGVAVAAVAAVDPNDSDVEIIEDPNKERSKRKQVGASTKQPPTLVTRLISVGGMSKRVVALGFCLSKYTDARAIHLINVCLNESKLAASAASVGGGGGGGGGGVSWLFAQISLF